MAHVANQVITTYSICINVYNNIVKNLQIVQTSICRRFCLSDVCERVNWHTETYRKIILNILAFKMNDCQQFLSRPVIKFYCVICIPLIVFFMWLINTIFIKLKSFDRRFILNFARGEIVELSRIN